LPDWSADLESAFGDDSVITITITATSRSESGTAGNLETLPIVCATHFPLAPGDPEADKERRVS
jgi:hypothetical protein